MNSRGDVPKAAPTHDQRCLRTSHRSGETKHPATDQWKAAADLDHTVA